MSNAVGSIAAENLAGSELFLGLSSVALERVFRVGRIRSFGPDVPLFHQGEPAERAHVLLNGRVRIFQGDSEGRVLVVRFIGPGETFGTLGLYTDHLYPATAITVTKTTEISWLESELRELLNIYPEIAVNLVRIAGHRLNEAQERLREVATQRVERRIANVLVRLAVQAGNPSDNGTSISFPIGRKDIAEMCGATLHTVSRTFRGWEKAGLLLTSRQRITISDLDGLKRLAMKI